MGYGLTSKMLVNLVDGCAQAKNVLPGSTLWTLDAGRGPGGADQGRGRGGGESACRRRRGHGPHDVLRPFYSYRLAPYPTFLVNGHLVREPW